MERPSRVEFAVVPPIGVIAFALPLVLVLIAGLFHAATRTFTTFVMAFPLLWVAGATIATLSAAGSLRMVRANLPKRTQALSSFRLRLTLVLRGLGFPGIGVLTSARFSTDGMVLEGPWAEIPILTRRLAGTSQWNVTTNRRGMLFVGPFRAAIELPGSAVRVTAVFEVVHAVKVLPATYQLQPFVDALLAGRHASAGRFEKLPVAIEEYVGVREYRPGDSPKLIHRVLSLRKRDTGQFYVREFEDPTRDDLSLVLDTARPLDGDPQVHRYRLEKAICFAYALCRTFAARNLNVRFICERGASDILSLRLRARDMDLDRLHTELTTLELQGNRTTVVRLLHDEVRRHGAAVIFISLRRHENVEEQRLPIVTLTPDHVPVFTREVVVQ